MKEPFEVLIEKHGVTVLRVCRSLVAPTEADDAWSETFLAAMRAYPDLPDSANKEAWLVTIARRKAIDLHRASQRRPLPTEDLPDALSTLGNPESVNTELWNLVGQLPDKQRQVITFRYLAGMSYSEVAAVVGGSVEAARRSCADGLAALRRSFPQAATNRASS